MDEKQIVKALREAGEKARPGERWRPVESVPGYAVSSHGRVFSMPCTRTVQRGEQTYTASYPGRIMQPFIGREGMRIQIGAHLGKPGPRYAGSIARLVLLAFVGEPPPDDCKLEVVHLDENPYNDRVENLRWATRGLGSRVRTAERMIEVGLNGGTVADAARLTAISMHHSMELSSLLRGAVGAAKGQPWPEVARMLHERKPDLAAVLRSRSPVYRRAERERRGGNRARPAEARA